VTKSETCHRDDIPKDADMLLALFQADALQAVIMGLLESEVRVEVVHNVRTKEHCASLVLKTDLHNVKE
jgi:hypothetical protein